jgi:hypothetical protein
MSRSLVPIREKILELCSEDYYGSWELWWAVSSLPESERDFIEAIEQLINEGKIVSKIQGADEKFLTVPFSRKRLEEEIRSNLSPDPDTFYWFGTPEYH